MSDKYVKILTTLLFFASLACYLHGLDRVQTLVWDEQYHVFAAHTYRQMPKENFGNPNNPPLGKELIALSMKIFGNTFFAYRFPSALAAAGITALLFFLGARLTRTSAGGMLAAGLWLTSTLAYLHARLAMLDMTLAFFFIAGLAAFLPIFFEKKPGTSGKRELKWLYLACFLAAWGGVVKVLCYALFPLFAFGLILNRKQWPLRDSLLNLAFAAFVFSSMALIFSYGILGYSPGEIPGALRTMYEIQSTPHRNHAGLSFWYEWFLLRGAHHYTSKPLADGSQVAMLCTSNPVLWIAGMLSIFALFYWSKINPYYLYLAASIPLQILFWTIFKKQSSLYYALPMEPVFCLSIALMFREWSQRVRQSSLFLNTWTLALLAASSVFFLRHWQDLQGIAFH